MKALVLSGGGAKGAYQAGVISQLIASGCRYDLVTGISVGAINGGFIAQFNQKQCDEAVDVLKRMWFKTTTRDVMKKWFAWPVSALWRPSVYSSEPLRDLLDRFIDHDRLVASDVRLIVGAVNFRTGRYRAFDFDNPYRGPNAVDAILASAAFPAMLSGVDIGGEHYIDGGIRTVSPLKSAIDAGATEIDVVMCSSVTHEPNNDSKVTTINVAKQAINVMSDEVMQKDLKLAALYNKVWREVDGKRKVTIRLWTPTRQFVQNPLVFDPEQSRAAFQCGVSNVYERIYDLI